MDAIEWIKDVICMDPLDIREFRGDRFAELMESYYLFKSKEEAGERYERAVDYINGGTRFEYYFTTDRALRLAAFGKEQS